MSETIFTSDTFTGPVERTFPTDTQPGGATYQEFVAQQTALGTFESLKQDMPSRVQGQFIEYGLAGDKEDINGTPIDMDRYFGIPIFTDDMEGMYEAAKEAYGREQDGSATPEDVALLEKVRDPEGTVSQNILYYSSGHPVLGKGYIDTGTFPKNSLTGEVEGLDVIPESPLGERSFDLVTTERDVAAMRAEDSAKLLSFVRNRSDAPQSDIVQNALVQSIEADIPDILAEGLYVLASASEEGARHYLPRFFHWAGSKTGLYDPMTEEQVAQDLALVRNSSFFANRQEIVNDLIRDQLLETVGEEALREAGYMEKIEVDGVERYKKEFVSQRFAEDFIEEVFDSKSFVSKIGILVAENVTAYNVLKAPFVFAGNAVRLVRRNIDDALGRPSATTVEGVAVPQKFSLMRPAEQLVVATELAAVRGVSAQTAARELAMMGKSPNFWNKWRSGVIADRVGAESAKMAVAAGTASSLERQRTLSTKLRNAQRRGNDQDIAKFSEQLRNERAYQNWRKIQSLVPTARTYGISPVFDTSMAFTQVMAREMMGPIGEAVGAGAFVGMYGIKKAFDLKGGIPIVTPLAAKAAFTSKVAIEDAAAFFFEMKSHAARGYAQGILVNPGLRGLVGAAPEELSQFLSSGQMKRVQDFSTNFFKGMNSDERMMMLDSMDQGFQDVEKVLTAVEDFVSLDQLRELRTALSLNLGQATGLGVFLSLEATRKTGAAGLSPKDVEKFTKKMKTSLNFQFEAERQVGAMTIAIEELDKAILRIEESITAPTPGRLVTAEDSRARLQALDNLKTLAGSFRNAETYGKRTVQKIIEEDKVAADRVITELTLESNKDFLNEAFISGQIDALMEVYGRVDQRYIASREVMPGGAEGIEAQEATAVTSAMVFTGQEVNTALGKLTAAVDQAFKTGRVSQNAEEVARTSNMAVVNLVELARAASKVQVDNAYAKISEDVQIPMAVFGSDMMRFFKSYAAEGESFIKYIDPVRFASFAGAAGEDFIIALQRSARKGMISYFDRVLPQINESMESLGFKFATGGEYADFLKRQIANDDPAFMQANGFRSFEDINDAQLSFYLVDNPGFSAIDASAFELVTNPKDLETLRQGTNALIRNGTEQQKQLGTLLKSEIDKAFDTWGQGANVDTYNAVVVARKTHQLERQRFGKGTFGFKVERLLGEERIADGAVEMGDTARISTLLTPIAKHLTNPTAQSAAQVKGLMDDLIATFAPVTSSMPEQVLKLGADGRYVLPKTEDLAPMAQRVMDEQSFSQLQILMEVMIKNAFYDRSNMKGLREALDAGDIPALTSASMPKRIDAPAAYSNADNPREAYFLDMQQDFVVNVVDEAGNITPKKLFDMDDLIMADRDIVNVVNAVPEYRQAHADLLSVAKTQREVIAGTEELAEEAAKTTLKDISDLPQFSSGQGFVKNVIDSDDPDAFDIFMNRTTSSQKYAALSDDQKKAGMQGLFTEVIKAAGGYSRSTRTVRMFDGQQVPMDSYANPAEVFMLLDDALTEGSQQGRKLRQLADAAGVTEEQLETLHAVFRLSTQVESTSLLAKQSDGSLRQLTKGFTLDNALSKAFNVARGMVSTEYVAAEIALKYAAKSQGKTLDFLLADPRAAGIVRNLLEDETKVTPKEAEYFSRALMKFVAGDLPATLLQQDVGSDEYAEQYWISQGLLFSAEDYLLEQTMP